MPSPLVFFQISTPDLERERDFLLELFDWRLGEPDERGTVAIDPQGPGDFDAKGAFRRVRPDTEPFVTLFFRVADLWQTVERAEALGAELVIPIRQNPGAAHFALIRTPGGLPVGIVQA